MYHVSLQLFPARQTTFRLLWLGAISLVAMGAVAAQPQRAKAQTEEKPLLAEFRGVNIGMPADEVRKKLGGPRDKGDDVDLYVFNDTQAVQVYYDKAKTFMPARLTFLHRRPLWALTQTPGPMVRYTKWCVIPKRATGFRTVRLRATRQLSRSPCRRSSTELISCRRAPRLRFSSWPAGECHPLRFAGPLSSTKNSRPCWTSVSASCSTDNFHSGGFFHQACCALDS